MQLGRYQLATPLMGGGGDGSYDYWLDQTSKLYYRAITPAQYRESLTAFFGAGNGALGQAKYTTNAIRTSAATARAGLG